MEAVFIVFFLLMVCLGIGVPVGLSLRAKDERARARRAAGLADEAGVVDSIIRDAKDKLRAGRERSEVEMSLKRYQALEKLKDLRDAGVIAEEEFLVERDRLLSKR